MKDEAPFFGLPNDGHPGRPFKAFYGNGCVPTPPNADSGKGSREAVLRAVNQGK